MRTIVIVAINKFGPSSFSVGAVSKICQWGLTLGVVPVLRAGILGNNVFSGQRIGFSAEPACQKSKRIGNLQTVRSLWQNFVAAFAVPLVTSSASDLMPDNFAATSGQEEEPTPDGNYYGLERFMAC